MDLATLTSKDRRTVKARLLEAGVAPIDRKGKVEYFASDLALQAILAPERGGTAHLSPPDRLAHTRNEIALLELAERRGDLLPRADVVVGLERRMTAIRARLLAIPPRLAPRIAPADRVQKVEDEITREVHDALLELADASVD